MFDKNNWYIEEKGLTEDQYREVCKYLVANHKDVSINSLIIDAAEGGDIEFFCRFDTVACVGGFFGSFDFEEFKGNTYLQNCTKITYQDFVEHLLNPSEMDSESVSEETNTNTQDGIEQPLKRITELCSRNNITLTFTPQLRVEVYADFGEWYIDLTEENAEEQLLKILEAVKVLNEADKL